MRLLFANPNLSTDIKVKFMNGLSKLDAKGIKDLDDILDKQGGFTDEAAARHRKDYGGFSDIDALLQFGCFACIPDFEYKKTVYNNFLT